MHLSPLVRRTLAPRGETPVLLQRVRHREKVSLAAALSVSPLRNRIGFYFQNRLRQGFNGELFAGFLREILKHLRGNVIIVLDNVAFHRSGAVKALQRRCPRMQFEYLPPYAPELNPVEQVWNWLKWSKFANYAPDSANELHQKLPSVLRALRRQTHRLKTFFRQSVLPCTFWSFKK